MNLRNARFAWQILVEEPVYAAVVVGGLAVGFATVILLLGFIVKSMTYDRFVPGHEQVHVVKTQFNYNGPGGAWVQAAPQILKSELDRSGLAVKSSGFLVLKSHFAVNNIPHQVRLALTHPDFQHVMKLPPVAAGDLGAALSRPDGIALTEDSARRLFGDTQVVGHIVQSNGKTLQILAVIATPPENSTFPYDALAGPDNAILSEELRVANYTSGDAWGWLNGGLFVRLDPSVTPADVERVLQRAIDDSPLVRSSPPELMTRLAGEKLMRIRLTPLADAYLDPDVSAGVMTDLHGNLRVLQALLAVAVLILLLSAANYINLASARTLQRQREIAIRKIMGAGVLQVVRQFVGESVMVALIACCLGLGLAFIMKPFFADMVNRNLTAMLGQGMVAATLGIGLLMGMLAGAYPAWVALKVRAGEALSGRGNSETRLGTHIRRLLTILQFTAAIALCAVSLAISQQTRYASAIDPGFDPKPLLIVDLVKPMSDPQAIAFRDAVKRLPGAAGVTVSVDAIGRHLANLIMPIRRDGGSMTTVQVKGVLPDFFEVYRIKAEAGRLFDPGRDANAKVVVIDAAAAKALGFPSVDAAIEQNLTDDQGVKYRIVGIAPYIRFQPLNTNQEPTIYMIDDAIGAMTVRARHGIPDLLPQMAALWKQYFPTNIMNATPAQAFFELQYADEVRVAHALALAAIIGFLIAGFGAYVLAAYTVQRRQREIVLRKLYGADAGAIGMLLLREFGALIGVSALLALPIGWYGIERYLAAYHEHAPLVYLPLAFALVAALVIAFVSMARHTVLAMRMRPARALHV